MLFFTAIYREIVAQLIGSDARRAASANIGWIFFDRAFRMGLGLLIIIWMARHLGPELFGEYNFVFSVVLILAAFTSLGLRDVVIREIVRDPENRIEILSAAFASMFLASNLCVLLILYISHAGAFEGAQSMTLIAILSFTLVFKSTDVVRFWFDAHVRSKVTIIAENILFVFMATARIYLIMTGAPLRAFIWMLVIEAGLLSVAFIFVLKRDAHAALAWRTLRNQYPRAKKLLTQAFPLLLGTLSVSIYLRIDQVMMGVLLDKEHVGIYAAAVRLSELWYFVPIAICASAFPRLVSLREENHAAYMRNLKKLYALMWAISAAAIFGIYLLGQLLVEGLYGVQYIAAHEILIIHILGGFFVALGLVRTRWILAEDLQRYSLYFLSTGMFVNIIGNYWLIPVYGGIGAAYATVITQATITIIMPLLFKPTRVCVAHMMKPF